MKHTIKTIILAKNVVILLQILSPVEMGRFSQNMSVGSGAL